jgi:Domain of unknown function (DUF4157)
MYQKQISQQESPLLRSTSKSQEISSNPSYAPLSAIVQRVQQDPNSVSKEETQQLESAIGSKSTKEILTGNKTSWVPEFKGISTQLWGDSGRVAPIQAKLTIGEVGDKYEQEADRVAKDVVQRINTPSTQTDNLQRQETEEELQLKEEFINEIVQRREATAESEVSTDLESTINSAKGSGQPLDENLQQSMGQAIGADFSGVKIHTDSQSDRLNRSLQAKAFTTGQDVFFKQGEYNPGSREGQELLAHELTHVVQQNGDAVQQKSIQKYEQLEARLDRKAETASHLTTVQKFAISTIGHNILQAMSLQKGQQAFSDLRNNELDKKNNKDELIKLITEAKFRDWLVKEKGKNADNPYIEYKNSRSDELSLLVAEFVGVAIENPEYQKPKPPYKPPVINIYDSTLLLVDDSNTHHFGDASAPLKQLSVNHEDLNTWFKDKDDKPMVEESLTTIYVFYNQTKRNYAKNNRTTTMDDPLVMGGFERNWSNEGVQCIFLYEGDSEEGFTFKGWVDFDHIPKAEDPNDTNAKPLEKRAIPDPQLLSGHVHPGNDQKKQYPLDKYQNFINMAAFVKTHMADLPGNEE